MKDEKYEIGQRVLRLRHEQGYSREALAKKANISPRFLASIEHGLKGMSSSTIIKLASALHTTTDSLLFGSKRQKETMELHLNGISQDKQKKLEEIFFKMIELCGG